MVAQQQRQCTGHWYGLVSVGMKVNYVSDFSGRGWGAFVQEGLGLLTVGFDCKALLILGLYKDLIIMADLSVGELVTL